MSVFDAKRKVTKYEASNQPDTDRWLDRKAYKDAIQQLTELYLTGAISLTGSPNSWEVSVKALKEKYNQ